MKNKRVTFAVNQKLQRNGKDVVPWIPCGTYYRADTGEFTITKKDFDDIIRNALERGLPLTIDSDHSMVGPTLGHANPATCFIENYAASPYQEAMPTLFSEVEWFVDDARDKWPFISPVVIFGSKRMATSKIGKAGDSIGIMIERLSLVDSPFFTMPAVNKAVAFSANGGQQIFEGNNKPGLTGSERRFSMNEELKQAIIAILTSGKSDEEKQAAIGELMASYSRTEIERYSRSYVSTWSALSKAFNVPVGDNVEAFGASIITAFNAANTDKAAVVKAFDTYVFNANEGSKKHQAAGWDNETAQVMFNHSRAKYDSKMAQTNPVLFNASPAVVGEQLPSNPLGDLNGSQIPMNRQQAQFYFYNQYISEQTKDGKRAFNQALADEAIRFADGQMSNFNGVVNS